MPTLTTNITSNYWSLSLDTPLAVVQDLEDLKQQVLVALSTDRGSVPFDPLFGFNINELLDKPVSFVIPNGKLGILETLERDVPLVKVEAIQHRFDPYENAGRVTFYVLCSTNLGNFAVAVTSQPNWNAQVIPLGAFTGGFSSGFLI